MEENIVRPEIVLGYLVKFVPVVILKEKNLLKQKKLNMKILGIGNAIIDVICKVEEGFLTKNDLTKGTMKLIFDDKEFKTILKNLKIEKLIKKIGIFRIKAKSIFNLSKILIKKHNGKVPKTFEELENLPGVGHKTAGVVMSQGFGYPAFPIDTHIHRLAQRWGLTNGKDVVQTEKHLKRLFAK